ncbi:RiPP maturation radical SAM C-methyltransferase [Azospirillum sp. TSO22-1]|uniref:RiPP maturation radical SAM C-methyltransferase n=1 Tax=Azospirillum sp. TSO22-1 TaxID=716789 RepID=UPI000D60AFA6|nr:RiPP maturation radical SAM C-methyltransferase [Azospirillum sp. TSO22-1]PWC56071.1 hypothetical protein TSO221_03255 [Azospirillum sp. TSO22-1]
MPPGAVPAGRERRADALLLSMPFGAPHLPSLGLSLLKATLERTGRRAEVAYLGLRFVDRAGYRLYQRIAQGAGFLLGEWIFRAALWGPPTPAQTDAFWRANFPDGTARLDPDDAGLKRRVAALQAAATVFVEDCAAAFDWAAYPVVGFTTLFQQDSASLALARRVKECAPATRVVFGGPNCDAEAGHALLRQFPFVDAVFSGPAEDNFPRYLSACLEGREPAAEPGVSVREAATGAVRAPAAWNAPPGALDDTAVPDFDDYFDQIATVAHPIRPQLTFETARGCWWGQKNHCIFCGLNGSSLAFRSKSPARAVDEIQHLARRYAERGVTLLRAVDQIIDVGYLDSVVPALAEAGIRIPIYYETKSNLGRAQVEALARANVRLLQPGIESLSTPLLRHMRKGCTMLQNVRLLKWCQELRIQPLWNLLYGFPGEPREEYARMAALIPAITHLTPPRNSYRVRLARHSPLFTGPERYGVANVRPHPVYRCLHPGLDDRALAERAYHYEFDFADGRTLDHCAPALAAVEAWMRPDGRGALLAFADGDGLMVWDRRPAAAAEWLRLDRSLADLARFCDDIRSTEAVRRRLEETQGRPVSAAEAEAALDALDGRRLVLRERGEVLALAIPAAVPPPPAARIAALPVGLSAPGWGGSNANRTASTS